MSTASEIYQRLIEKEITESKGSITFNFLNTSVKIKEKNAIGDLFQEWITNWMESEGIFYRKNKNTQDFPDFFLDEISDSRELLEIKTFNFGTQKKRNSPSFDVANFEAYTHSLKTKAYRLDADYLIFAYSLIDGDFRVENIWLKKVWEITGKGGKHPITIQSKDQKYQKKKKDTLDKIDNIRPFAWYSERRTTLNPFMNRLDFVTALYDTLMLYSKTQQTHKDWLEEVKENYLYHTRQKL